MNKILNQTECIAHINKQKEVQFLKEHSENVAECASNFASEFGCEKWGKVLGLFHDLGKQTPEFQNHIKAVTGYDTSCIDIKTEHSYIGALQVYEEFNKSLVGHTLYQIILSHHTGLFDRIKYLKVINEKTIPSYISPLRVNETLILPTEINIQTPQGIIDYTNFTRVLLSCLVDADFLDTENFMRPYVNIKRFKSKCNMSALKEKLDSFLGNMKPKQTLINKYRKQLQTKCINASQTFSTFNKLIIPTGAGKTLDSLIWAVYSAVNFNKHRVIVAIPYISVTTQTAKIFKEIFGNENVLEIHSNYEPASEEEILLSENFDAPIIVTTNVQVLESMFSNKVSKCRKLHNFANSIIIFDEIQNLPLNLLQPIADCFKSYGKLFGTQFLFMSATELPIGKQYPYFNCIENIRDLTPNSEDIFKNFERTKIVWKKTPYTYQSIANELCNISTSVLCIVYKRMYAKKIYQQMLELTGNDTNLYHLSKNMCAQDIQNTIDEIQEKLKKGIPVKVVSTCLIEAGVDIDFPCVYKMEDGLDSIRQAAGRCNREGLLPVCNVIVFSLCDENGNDLSPHYGILGQKLRFFKETANFSNYGLDTKDAMNYYFDKLFANMSNNLFDETSGFDNVKVDNQTKSISINNCLMDLNFQTAGENFNIIDNDNQVPIIIPYGDGEKLITEIIKFNDMCVDFKELTRYMVNVSAKEFKFLLDNHYITELLPDFGFYKLVDKSLYNKTGIVTSN